MPPKRGLLSLKWQTMYSDPQGTFLGCPRRCILSSFLLKCCHLGIGCSCSRTTSICLNPAFATLLCRVHILVNKTAYCFPSAFNQEELGSLQNIKTQFLASRLARHTQSLAPAHTHFLLHKQFGLVHSITCMIDSH